MTTETKEVTQQEPIIPTEHTPPEQERVPFTQETIKGMVFQTIDPNGNTIQVKAEQLINLIVRYVRNGEIVTHDKSVEMVIGDAVSIYPELLQIAQDNRPFIGMFKPEQGA
ncbi:hypothetical protein PO467_20305 [Enterobacter kobei]|uniref:hypothetical protein n=1 Tax=Enterobacter cloacae complex TaxID=354276 RepID=UPI000B8E58C1|nr:hypothetical protein [Enterobacter kobei]DAF38838.1 MAG TPA: hypothetical protein [Caudoviricetes sp.]HBV6848705.1 hypothetical protein [Klebsiella pneumoniae]ELC0997468.1 hypothetical protein [Enterobacter kobei]MCL5532313.1 hypothetical protein [Enterobacter kobei]OXV29668.1 hypothetical protein CDL31_19305 [Enterobacter kobei]